MEVLLWLVPAGVVLVLAMLWAGWQGRREQRVVDRDEAVRRLGRALDKPARTHDRPGVVASRPADRSTAVAVRRPAPRPAPAPAPQPAREPARKPAREPAPAPCVEQDEPHRRTA